jgi:hypothetical protein
MPDPATVAAHGAAAVAEANILPNEPPVTGAVPQEAVAVLSPAAAQQLSLLHDGVNSQARADAIFGLPDDGRWLDTVAGEVLGRDTPEVADARVEELLPLREARPDGTVPLSQGEDLVNGFLPFDAGTLEAALKRFLEQLQVPSGQLAGLPLSSWLLAGAALAVAGEALRRRWRRQTDLVSAGEMEDTLRWFPHLGHTEEDG